MMLLNVVILLCVTIDNIHSYLWGCPNKVIPRPCVLLPIVAVSVDSMLIAALYKS